MHVSSEKDRTILHVDLNNFFASVECAMNPSLLNKPVAVCGSVEERHGIVLAKNQIAKKLGVRTGETVSEAKNQCPALICVPPHIDRYLEYSARARDIYRDYTSQVESFGVDECWLDLTGSINVWLADKGSGVYTGRVNEVDELAVGAMIADEIRARIRSEMGVTASVGVSFNKVFAKMGSDYKKPDATTVVSRANFKTLIWRLPVGDLLFVGGATFRKLLLYNIRDIGDLARADYHFIETLLGKNGCMLWRFANGLDMSPVSESGTFYKIKSIGNSTTTGRDLLTPEDVRITLSVLSDSVSARLRADNFKCGVVALHVRDKTLAVYERQTTLREPTWLARDILDTAFDLFLKNDTGVPVRSVGVRGCSLVPQENIQLTLCDDPLTVKAESAGRVVDELRTRYGAGVLKSGLQLLDLSLSDFSPKDDHVVYPDRFVRA